METKSEQEIQDKEREYAEDGLWMGHYHYLLQALAVAVSRCQVWRLAETGDVLTMLELFEFAKDYDTEHPLKEGQFYMVTIEGAIGLSPGVEYLTQWMFTPMEPGRERDYLLEELQEKLDKMEEEERQALQGGQAMPVPPPVNP